MPQFSAVLLHDPRIRKLERTLEHCEHAQEIVVISSEQQPAHLPHLRWICSEAELYSDRVTEGLQAVAHEWALVLADGDLLSDELASNLNQFAMLDAPAVDRIYEQQQIITSQGVGSLLGDPLWRGTFNELHVPLLIRNSAKLPSLVLRTQWNQNIKASLPGHVVMDDYLDMSTTLQSLNTNALHIAEHTTAMPDWKLFLWKPLGTLVRNLLLRGGFQDGLAGGIHAMLMMIRQFLVAVYVLEARRHHD